jgi:hypothetical protein
MEPTRGVHDLGYERGAEFQTNYCNQCGQKLSARSHRTEVFVHICGSAAARTPPGYFPAEIILSRAEGEPLEAFEAVARSFERILCDTELELTQPGTDARYVRLDDSARAPITGGLRTFPGEVSGYSWIVFLAPNLAKAEDIERIEEGRRRS